MISARSTYDGGHFPHRYFTCSRGVARELKALHGNVMSSTGGPNTLVSARLTYDLGEDYLRRRALSQ